ncbi:VOC family protein [Aquipuribacter nitratireducens]|uniref:VOC family protein n=1 Tax=Aquipuribacter nitratireducens TaxID=650104 RepID=A0ABW0GQM7_9MICO
MAAIGTLHHVGITVKDLEASLAWYSDVLGVEPEWIAEGSGEELGRAVGVPDARLRFAMLRLGNAVVELLCYDNGRDETFTRSNADVGSAHVCIDVPDIRAAYEDLQAKGVQFLAPPLDITDGPLAGCAFAYFRDPDGVTLEIFQHETGAAA